MNVILPFDRIASRHRHLVGGKALTLATLMQRGIAVPDGLCITTAVYRDYVRKTGLETRIGLELGRLPLAEMRWEEIWDAALRIRNLFLNTMLPDHLIDRLVSALNARFAHAALVVRSSSPHEDRTGTSFAGLHDSYVNVRGIDAVLHHIRLVWASLWSDGALLYRRELGLDLKKSAMAVIVQELVAGDRSGVAFSMSPDGADHAMVESVYGLNQGLVDDAVAPDRWTLDRRTGAIISHTPAVRERAVRAVPEGTRQMPLSDDEQRLPPLDPDALGKVFRLAMMLEEDRGCPQDVEWTFRQNTLFMLQSRPVTTVAPSSDHATPWSEEDKRPWYRSLKRSFASLKVLHRRIEDDLLPRMAREADQMAAEDLSRLATPALIDTIQARIRTLQHWTDVYWRDLIPFAHGTRLFGQIYNDLVKPDDPYAFTALLGATEMTGLARNRELEVLAGMVRTDRQLHDQLTADPAQALPPAFADRLDAFIAAYGDSTFKSVRLLQDREGLIRLLLEMAGRPQPAAADHQPDIPRLCAAFIARFPEDRRDFARDLLDIGRASYRLRDNDNLVLARIEAQLIKAVDEGKRRIRDRGNMVPEGIAAQQVVRILEDPEAIGEVATDQTTVDEPVQHLGRPDLAPMIRLSADGDFVLRARQVIGQPAGPGLAVGKARLIATVDDLFQFRSGEILVCDAIDPNMTVVVPLAAAIVERRGGMLVHGAIIAREYGLPCVTGVADATTLIHTGDRLTVDGYLGIVTVDG